MIRARRFAGAGIAAAFVLAPLVAASPASAVPLPEGQHITVLDFATGIAYDANPDTAALILLGPGVPLEDDDFATALEVDDSGFGFALVAEAEGGVSIRPFDANTGTAGEPVIVSVPSVGVLASGCGGLDLATDGRYYTACHVGDGEGGELTHFGWIDPTTGVLTVLQSFDQRVDFLALASDPVTGEFWAFEFEDGGLRTLWSIDTATWAFTEIRTLDQTVDAADFDRSGRLWVTSDFTPQDQVMGPSSLSLLDPATGVFANIAPFVYEGENLSPYGTPLTVWGVAPEPLLPVTGSSGVPIALGAALLLLLAGAAFALPRRRGVHRSAS